MNIDFTQIALWAMSFTMGCLGWFCRQIWWAINDLRKDASKLREDLPREYMPITRMDMIFNKLDSKMDRLLDKLDMKADK